MEKMWAGRFLGTLDKTADDFNSSISFDKKMYRQDITGSMAHAAMLGAKNIIAADEADKIIAELEKILLDIEAGVLAIDENCEDIHMFVETVLTDRIGDLGKKLHTARSRNDQVALDLRMYMRDQIDEISVLLKNLVTVITDKAEEHKATIMPGYTHLQRAQPITFGQHLMAYAMMFLRDIDRLADAKKRTNYCPIGSCALAGTTYDTDRRFEAEKLGFPNLCLNSMDGVSDRDFCVEFLACASLIMVHLSRFSEEIILWSSWEFKFIELDDAFTTGSSIMPQKKNPDMAELTRGKTGRVFGDLITMLTVLKGIPLAYNKDMQEDKEAVFDACDTVKMCLEVFTPMLATAVACEDNMKKAASGGFICATDLADYLVRKGLPFRSAYKIVGAAVAKCIASGKTLETLEMEEYKTLSDVFEPDLYEAIDLAVCVEKRISLGGTSPQNVQMQVEWARDELKKY